MQEVTTVLGQVGVEALGPTLMHEHIYVQFPGTEFDPEFRFDRTAFLEKALERLRILKTFGVTTIVDPTPIELGRDVELIAEVSRKAGITIVCSTGFYTERVGIPGYWRIRSTREIADLFIREIRVGIADTGIRAGAIKCATSGQHPSALEARILEAVSIAHLETSAPIITHTENDLGASEQQEEFARHGVPLHRCLIGHCSNSADPDYHRAVVDRGSYIGFDRIGLTYRHTDETHADNVARLVKAGFVDRIMLSQDRYVQMGGRPYRPQTPEELAQIGVYEHLFTTFVPLLTQRGVGEADIRIMIEENPRRFFAGVA